MWKGIVILIGLGILVLLRRRKQGVRPVTKEGSRMAEYCNKLLGFNRYDID